MQDALIVHQPAAGTAASELLLMFHGVGSSAEDLVPLGQAMAPGHRDAWMISIRSPHKSDFGQGWQWFSVQGVDEASRPARIAAAMPDFVKVVRHWQQHTGVSAANTTLLGFSQGAIMALESTQVADGLAARVVSMAGRFAQLPQHAPARTAIHLLHGDNDPVIPAQFARDADAQLRKLGAVSTLDVFGGLGHGIDGRVLQRLLEILAG